MKTKTLTLFSLVLALAACGGGGNQAPADTAQSFPPITATIRTGTSSCVYPVWQGTTKYLFQNVVSYQGALYEAWSANINKQPTANPKVWVPYTCLTVTAPVGQCTFPEWTTTKRYMPGDRVLRLGKNYQSLPITATVWNVNSSPEYGPNYWGELVCTEEAPPTQPAPDPTPAPTPAPTITVGSYPNTLLQMSEYWMEDGVWGAGDLTLGTFTGITGSQYEQYIGVSPSVGSNGEVAGRIIWKWPTGTTEVKSYPSFVVGKKPGWSNTWITPGGFAVQLPNGTQSQVYPSGPTPNTWLPLQYPLPNIYSSFNYQFAAAPTGRGHLTYDIFLQNTPDQCHGFDNCQEITHEIMIPLDFWGGYGQYKAGGGGRNPSWYIKDATIDGRLFHLFAAQNADGTLTANFGGGWKFIVFEPDQPIAPGTINITSFLNYITTMKDSAGTPWAAGTEWLSSIELGVEPVDGTGDLTISNYRVWK